MDDLKKRVLVLETDIISLGEDVKVVVELLESIDKGIKFFIVLGRFAKWLTYILGLIAICWSLYYAVKTGQPPVIHIGENKYD